MKKTNLASHHFRKGNSLSFSARNTADELISNQCFLGVADAQRIKNVVSHILDEMVLLFHMLGSLAGNFVSKRKLHRLVDSQSREMNIIYQGYQFLK